MADRMVLVSGKQIISEGKLSRTDRLGLAYCRLNKYEWDELIGEKPADFDSLPRWIPKKLFRKRKQRSKEDYVSPALEAIESILGEANCSRCWWIFELGKTEKEWFFWYVTKRFRGVN